MNSEGSLFMTRPDMAPWALRGGNIFEEGALEEMTNFHVISRTSWQIVINVIKGITTLIICKLDGPCDPPEGRGNCIRCIDCNA